MRIINKTLHRFGNLNAQVLANKNKNSIRFEAQNLAWDYQIVDYHCKAFAKGLKQINVGSNDNLLVRIPPNLQAESFVAKVGSAYLDSNLIISKANTIDELDQQISQNQIKGFIFEPTLILGEKLLIDCLYDLIPELKNTIQGSSINSSRYNALKMLIQTNFYTYPGVFKYRSIFNYASDEMTPFNPSNSHQPLPAHSDMPLIITQPAHNFAFRAGILNSLINGSFVICAEPNDVSRIINIYENKVKLVGTQECAIPNDIQVVVEKGSDLFRDHKNRTEL